MKLLALVESPDHVCCRYRIRAFAPRLDDAGCVLSCEAIERGPLKRILQLSRASHFDAVVLQRKLLPGWQLKMLRRCSRHLVYDFDDAVGFRDSYHHRGQESGWRSRRFGWTVRLADTVVAGNDFLADCALRAGARVERVHVIPTCVEPRSYPMARHVAGTEPIDLVWIGSASTLKGLEQSLPIWERLARAVPNLRLRVICDRFPEHFPIPVVRVDWNEATEASALAAAQIGVSWLPDDVWSRGKCGLKILQYQAAGLPVVANPVGSHLEMIKEGETGFLASSPDEWVAAVSLLVGDAPLRRQMGNLARERVAANYSVSAWGDTFVTSMTGTTRPAAGSSWKVDRPALPFASSAFLPHALRVKAIRTLNQIGDR